MLEWRVSYARVSRWLGGMPLCLGLVLAGCGGAGAPSEAPQAAVAGERNRALAYEVQAVAPEEAARQLMDFAERAFPVYFPAHPQTQRLDPYLYRHYPETDNYLGVANGHVYVLGPRFGALPVDVGALESFISPVAQPSAALVGPSTGTVDWGVPTTARFELRDSNGELATGALSCASDSPASLQVAADCSALTGLRVGSFSVTVKADLQSTKAHVRVMAPRHPLATLAWGNLNFVVTADGRVLGWGNNGAGNLSLGDAYRRQEEVALPQEVKSADGSPLQGIVAVSAGPDVALALTKDGDVYSWGTAISFLLGRETDTVAANRPGKINITDANGVPRRIVAIAAGDSSALALADDGVVLCWGGWCGQAAGSGLAKRPIVVVGVAGAAALPQAVAISIGGNWNLVLLADGRVVSWGFRNLGNLGRPAVGSNVQPGFVLSAISGKPLTDIVSVSAGAGIGLALTATGQVYAWGDQPSAAGQGTGMGSRSGASLVLSPDGLKLLSDITMVSAGGNHALVLDVRGAVLAWGEGGSGVLGQGSLPLNGGRSMLPMAVRSPDDLSSLNRIAALSSSYAGSSALTQDGSVLLWGTGVAGALAQGPERLGNSTLPLIGKGQGGVGTLALSPMSLWPNLTRRAR